METWLTTNQEILGTAIFWGIAIVLGVLHHIGFFDIKEEESE